MAPTLLILGASRYYSRAIEVAQEEGCRVVAVDRDSNAEGSRKADVFESIDITNIIGCLDAARRHGIDGVLPLNDFGLPTAAHISQELRLAGIAPAVADVACSKRAMREAFEQHDVPSARFRTVRTKADAHRAVAELGTWPLIVKPSNSQGGGSRGVMRISSSAEVEQALAFAQSFYDFPEVVIEECFEGSEHSVETITYDGRTSIIAVSEKVKTPPPYRVDKTVIYPSGLSSQQLSALEEVVTAAISAVGVDWGPVHVELCYQSDGPRVIELGARCGGGGSPDPIVPYVTGVEMLREVIRMSLGEAPSSLAVQRQWGCVYHFLTPPPGILDRVEALDQVRDWEGILDCDVSIQVGEEIRPVRVGSDRAGFVIAGNASRDVAIRLAEKAESTIKFHLRQPRDDALRA